MDEAKKLGLEEIFVIEDIATEDKWLGGLIKDDLDEKSLISLLIRGPNEVNWKCQWETFAENFQNGVAHIDLSRFGNYKTLHLLPGEGFGDLSHATTYLMMDLMKDKLKDKDVVDVGSGSGILTLSSKLMGAKSSIGVEINMAALRHAEKNALKNTIDATFVSHLNKDKVQKDCIVLMNMTLYEQVGFMEINEILNEKAKCFITSGILSEQKDQYLKRTIQWGWELVEEKVKDKWLGFIFLNNHQNKKGRKNPA